MSKNYEIVPLDINADIHNHTRGSDGRQTTFRAILRAYSKGFNVMAATDHDSVKGLRNLDRELYSVVNVIKEDKSYDPDKIINILNSIKIIKGAELITSYGGIAGIEILSYDFDIDIMEEEINRLRNKIKIKPYELLYKELSKKIDDKKLVFDKTILDEAFNKIRIENRGGVVGPFFKELSSHEENRKYLKYIDENGEEKEADTVKLFINKHLYNTKSELFVDMSETRPSFKDTINAIHKAHGKAFLAHPGRYKDKLDIENVIDDMIKEGLDGIEVFYPDHSYEFRTFLLSKVKEYNLMASGGSDDHNTIKEGKQYRTGIVSVPDIKETSWIKDIIINKKDFISESKYLQSLIEELEKIKKGRFKRK